MSQPFPSLRGRRARRATLITRGARAGRGEAIVWPNCGRCNRIVRGQDEWSATTIMLGSFFADNPLLAAIAVTAAIAVVVRLLRAATVRLFGRRRSRVAGTADAPESATAWGYAEPAPVETAVAWAPDPGPPPPRQRRRSGFGFGAVA